MTITSIIQMIMLIFCAGYFFVRWFNTGKTFFNVMSAVSVGIAISVVMMTKI